MKKKPGRIFNLFLLFFVFGQFMLNAQEINFNDPNLSFRDGNNNIISKDSANTIISTNTHYLTIKNLDNGKKEAVLIPKSKALAEANNITSGFIAKWKGKKLPDFDLKTLKGKSINNSQFKNKVVVVNFWFIQCKPCVAEMPALNKLVDKYKGKPVIFLAPSLDSPTALDKFFQKNIFNYQILPEAKGLANEMELRAYPTHLVIDQNGIIKDILIGGTEDIHHELDTLIGKEL